VDAPPTAAPPDWLEAAARLDAIIADRVPLPPARPEPDADDEDEAPAPPAVPAPEVKPRLSATPIAVPDPPTATGEEVALGWHGYDAAALLPSTAALGLLTAGVLLGLRRLVPPAVVVEAVYAPLAALWAGQAVRAAYRLLAYSYRLTTRRLFRERGPLYPREAPLDLATVARAEVRQTPLDRVLGVGAVRVVPEESSGRPAVELTGVRRPRALAAAVEAAARAARDGAVAEGKAELATDEHG
jgi:hypothetical protein